MEIEIIEKHDGEETIVNSEINFEEYPVQVYWSMHSVFLSFFFFFQGMKIINIIETFYLDKLNIYRRRNYKSKSGSAVWK